MYTFIANIVFFQLANILKPYTVCILTCMNSRLPFLFECLTFSSMSSSGLQGSVFPSLPPSCSGVMAPDCLIPSRGIGDIRPNPVPTSPESQQRGSAGMKSSGTARISQCEEAIGKEEGIQSMSS